MEGVLDGIMVLDMSRHVAGPYCSVLLADMGAEVIRVELPGGDEDRHFGHLSPSGDSWTFPNRMRNKKAITLNLRRPQAKEIFQRLVDKADIILENFAMRDREKLGLDFPSLVKIKPSIIVASVSAFGLDGPNTNRIGFDPIAQAISGSMSFNGFPGGPPMRAAGPWVDYATAIHSAFGVLLALRHRDKTGKGQVVDVALADVAAGLVALQGVFSEYEKEGLERTPTGNRSPYAFADVFQAKDGWVFISLTRNGVWKRFLKAAEMEDLDEDPIFSSDWKRAQNCEALNKIVAPWIAAKRALEVVSLMERAGVPCAEVNGVSQAFSEPQYRDRKILVDMEHPGIGTMSTLGTIVKLSETPGTIRRGSPLISQHNREVYKDLLGYTDQEISVLEKEGVI